MDQKPLISAYEQYEKIINNNNNKIKSQHEISYDNANYNYNLDTFLMPYKIVNEIKKKIKFIKECMLGDHEYGRMSRNFHNVTCRRKCSGGHLIITAILATEITKQNIIACLETDAMINLLPGFFCIIKNNNMICVAQIMNIGEIMFDRYKKVNTNFTFVTVNFFNGINWNIQKIRLDDILDLNINLDPILKRNEYKKCNLFSQRNIKIVENFFISLEKW